MIGLELYIYVDNVVHGIDLFKDNYNKDSKNKDIADPVV